MLVQDAWETSLPLLSYFVGFRGDFLLLKNNFVFLQFCLPNGLLRVMENLAYALFMCSWPLT